MSASNGPGSAPGFRPDRPAAPFGTQAESRDHQVTPGWWLAADDRWYPPHLHPNYAALQQAVAEENARPNQGSDLPPPSLLGLSSMPRGVSVPREGGMPGRFTMFRIGAGLVGLTIVMVSKLIGGFDDDTRGRAPDASADLPVVTLEGERLTRWNRLEHHECFNFLSSTRGELTTVRATGCTQSHDAQVITVEQGDPLRSEVISALMAATLPAETSTTTPEGSPSTIGTIPADPDADGDDVIYEAMQQRCEELAVGRVVEELPSDVVIWPMYSESLIAPTPDAPDPVLLCVLTAADERQLLKSFTR